jgi:AcrR family transcriptional regulator
MERAVPRTKDVSAKIRLLAAAEAVFVESGLDRAKVEDITKKAGLSKGAFYLHFESKEHAFRQLAESIISRMASYLDAEQGSGSSRADPAAYFRGRIEKDTELFEFMWQSRGLMRLLLEGGKSATFGYLIDEFAERACHSIAELLTMGVKDGLYDADLDVELTSVIISGAYDRIVRQMVKRRTKPDIAAWLEKVQRVVLFGIANDALREKVKAQSPKPTRARRKA